MNTMLKIYPFKFLDAYAREDSQFFFGRNEEIDQLYSMIFQTDLLLIYGASGTGKTSLIQCGLASKFETHEWLPLFIRRGNDLNQSFEKVLTDNGGIIENSAEDLDWLDQDWTSEIEVTSNNLSTLAKRLRAIYLKNFKPIYLIFDQFEELYILGSKEEQELFFKTIKELLQLEQPVKMIISIREEYLGHLYEFERKVPELLRKKLRVESMIFDKIKSVIKGIGNLPQSNVSLCKDQEDEFCEKVFQKIKGEENRISIDLPYLQVLLDKLYLDTTKDETRQADAVFSLEILENLGNIGDVLRNFLDEQVMLATREYTIKPDLIWHVLSPFVTLEGTKEPLALTDIYDRLPNVLPETIHNVIQFFENKRILRYSEKDEMYEIAHDSLARQVNARRSDEEIALLEVHRLIKSQSALKDNAREYFSAKQLAFIEPFVNQLQLNSQETELIDQSRQACELEHQKELRQLKEEKKRQQRILLIITAAAIVSILFGVFGVYNKKQAEKNLSLFISETANTFFIEERFDEAKAEFEKLETCVDTIDGVQKQIKKCENFDRISKIFYSNIGLADSLISSKKDDDFIKADSLYKSAKGLKYKQGYEKMEAKFEANAIRNKQFIENKINIAETFIVYGNAMYPEARKILHLILKLEPNNKEALALLNKIA